MCFGIVEAQKKLFIAPSATAAAAAAPTASSAAALTPSSAATAAAGGSTGTNRSELSDSKRRSSAAATVGSNANDKKVSVGKSSAAATSKMSRSKSRLQTELCGDCGASDPSWASINRGILLCSDCCSVHRSLGRHISIVKSLRQGTWEPSVLNFVNSLNAHGANSVWEHHLLDGPVPSSGAKGAARLRKPSPKDALHPTKSDFIRTKHVNLAFVLKPQPLDQDELTSGGGGGSSNALEQELSKQLHASVRTSNLETSLRLLVQGADPNFYHEEKHSTPLHVAAKFGQASQIELLLVYGGDVNALDGNGCTALEVARANNHNTIAERLLDAMFEVTDRIIMFLGGKKPDHTTGRHLIIPENCLADISEQLKIARGRLQLVPNKMFEELVSDLYDEVDRRESEAIWATSTVNADSGAVPFLPANPFLSATRNQGRQKLARFSRAEFAGLLTDVLIDARRRQNMANLRPMDATIAASTPNTSFYNNSSQGHVGYNNNNNMSNNSEQHELSNLSDDEPIYDPVASDDDYAPVPPMAQQAIIHYPGTIRAAPVLTDVDTLRQQLNDYQYEIHQLKTVVQKLSSENTELKSKFQASISGSVYDEPLRIDGGEPLSLPLEGNGGGGGGGGSAPPCIGGSNSSSSASSGNNSNQSTIKRPASMYERRLGGPLFVKSGNPETGRSTASMYQMADKSGSGVAGLHQQQQLQQHQQMVSTTQQQSQSQPSTPTASANIAAYNAEVKHRCDIITPRLKELAMLVYDGNSKDALVPCADRIRVAVIELAGFLAMSSTQCTEGTREVLRKFNHHNMRLQQESEHLRKAYDADDMVAIEQCILAVRDCVFNIASCTKTIVMQYE